VLSIISVDKEKANS